MELRRRGRPNKHPRRIDKTDRELEPVFCEECGARLIHAPIYDDFAEETYVIGPMSPSYELVCPRCGLVHEEEEEKKNE